MFRLQLSSICFLLYITMQRHKCNPCQMLPLQMSCACVTSTSLHSAFTSPVNNSKYRGKHLDYWLCHTTYWLYNDYNAGAGEEMVNIWCIHVIYTELQVFPTLIYPEESIIFNFSAYKYLKTTWPFCWVVRLHYRETSDQSQHSAETLVLVLVLCLISVPLNSWSKVHFPIQLQSAVNSTEQKHPTLEVTSGSLLQSGEQQEWGWIHFLIREVKK